MKLQTDRLVLREFNQSDLSELSQILSDPEVMKFSTRGCLSTAQTQIRIDDFINSYNQFGFGMWAVILKDTYELVGYCGLAIDCIDDFDELEIGYRLATKFWGKGFATEAALACIQYGFENFNSIYSGWCSTTKYCISSSDREVRNEI
jgi:RimJ/RimL family protein N-acetyltransferase